MISFIETILGISISDYDPVLVFLVSSFFMYFVLDSTYQIIVQLVRRLWGGKDT